MARSRKERAQGRREDGLFIPLPLCVIQSENFRTLPPVALKLFMALLGQLEVGKGGPRNNGNLCAAHKVLQEAGAFGSKSTVASAKRILLERGWIEQTRHGGLHMGPDLYAITVWAIDDCEGRLEVSATIANICRHYDWYTEVSVVRGM